MFKELRFVPIFESLFPSAMIKFRGRCPTKTLLKVIRFYQDSDISNDLNCFPGKLPWITWFKAKVEFWNVNLESKFNTGSMEKETLNGAEEFCHF